MVEFPVLCGSAPALDSLPHGADRVPVAARLGDGRTRRLVEHRRLLAARVGGEIRDSAVRVRRRGCPQPVPGGGQRIRSGSGHLRDQGLPLSGHRPHRARRGSAVRRRQRWRAARRPRRWSACLVVRHARQQQEHRRVAAGDQFWRAAHRRRQLRRARSPRRLTRRRLAGAGRPVPRHARRSRPHPHLHRNRAERLQVRLQPRQR